MTFLKNIFGDTAQSGTGAAQSGTGAAQSGIFTGANNSSSSSSSSGPWQNTISVGVSGVSGMNAQMGLSQLQQAGIRDEVPYGTVTEEHLKTGAYAPSLDSLRDLWEVRFGEHWVGSAELAAQEDPLFYQQARDRLFAMQLLEVVHPGASGRKYRIIPRTK